MLCLLANLLEIGCKEAIPPCLCSIYRKLEVVPPILHILILEHSYDLGSLFFPQVVSIITRPPNQRKSIFLRVGARLRKALMNSDLKTSMAWVIIVVHLGNSHDATLNSSFKARICV